jgi:hypothetical protein
MGPEGDTGGQVKDVVEGFIRVLMWAMDRRDQPCP